MSRLRLALALVIGFSIAITALLVSGKQPPDVPPGTGGEATLLREAIKDLKSPDYSVVRDAIYTINSLESAPNLQTAIDPLSTVLTSDSGFYDSYTRCIAAHSLAGLANRFGSPKGDIALKSVIYTLQTGKVDLVRAACAKTLGSGGFEEAYEHLVQAEQNDKSPLVRVAACEGLTLLTNGQYSSGQCDPGPQSNQMLTVMPQSKVANQVTPIGIMSTVSGSEEMERWVKNHVLLPPELIIPEVKVSE
jgi:hypothetical protein